MWELFALILYSLQWLGVVLGVGAEAVLLVAHLLARHAREPEWLGHVPAVEVVQRWGLVFIVGSGLGAVAYQLFNDASVLFIPTFGFKWLLIALCVVIFFLERWRESAWVEGFAGATWLALFVVHSVAPIFMWVDLLFFYAIWLGVFYAIWWSAVFVMGAGARRAPQRTLRPAEPVEKKISAAARPSLWQRLLLSLGLGHHDEPIIVEAAPAQPPPPPPKPAAPPPMARASAPVRLAPQPAPAQRPSIPSAPVRLATPPPPPPKPAPSNLPAVEHLELAPPLVVMAPPPPPPKEPPTTDLAYVPDYAHLPGVRVMPQKPEDLARESRAPIVQTA